MIAKVGFFLKPPIVFPYFIVTVRYVACFSQIILNTYVVFFSTTLFKTWRKTLRTKYNSSFLLKYRKLPFLLYFMGFVLCVQHSAPPKIAHLKVPLKNESELCMLVDCICSLYVLSSGFSAGLILLVENCVAVLHGQDCCHVGPADLTASLLLKDFQCFSFNTSALFPGQKEIITPREMIPYWQGTVKQRLPGISQSPAHLCLFMS